MKNENINIELLQALEEAVKTWWEIGTNVDRETFQRHFPNAPVFKWESAIAKAKGS